MNREIVVCQNPLQAAAWLKSNRVSPKPRFLDGREFWGDQGAERWVTSLGFSTIKLDELNWVQRRELVFSDMSDPHQLALSEEIIQRRSGRRLNCFRGRSGVSVSSNSFIPSRGWLTLEEKSTNSDHHLRWAQLQNKKIGETCVILGNGPSLNRVDFSLLREVDTFGVNSIFLAKHRLTKPLTYYVVEDNKVMEENLVAIAGVEAEHKFFPEMYREGLRGVSAWRERDDDAFFTLNTGFYDQRTPSLAFPRFTMDVGGRVFAGQTVTYINLQLAFWLGYRKVILVGMDFSYSIPESSIVSGHDILSQGPDPNHFHPDYFGEGKTWRNPKLDRVLLSYQHAKSIYELYGREIVNATEGGKLEVFRREGLREAIQT